MIRRPTAIVLVMMLLVTSMLLVGCGDSEETTEGEVKKMQEKGDAGSAPEQSTPSSGASVGPDGNPTRALADFPNGQDGASVEAVLKTDKGEIVLQFYPEDAPVHVANFLELARSGFYDGTRFHRVIPEFVAQGGDPKSKDPNAPDVGTGGPGYYLPLEPSDRKHQAGSLAMARSQHPNSAGSQFYICLAPQPSLDGQYTVFGEVVSGMDVVNSIVQGDVIPEVTIRPKSTQ